MSTASIDPPQNGSRSGPRPGPRAVAAVAAPGARPEPDEETRAGADVSVEEWEKRFTLQAEEDKSRLRKQFGWTIVVLFALQTLFLLALLGFFGCYDVQFMTRVLEREGPLTPEMYETVTKGRFITPGVLMAMIAATVTEVAAATAAITYHVFGKPRSKAKG